MLEEEWMKEVEEVKEKRCWTKSLLQCVSEEEEQEEVPEEERMKEVEEVKKKRCWTKSLLLCVCEEEE